MADIAAMKLKIAKLLAKAERTDNDHERDAFTTQAERLMLRLGIERAELESVGEIKPEEIVEHRREWTGSYSMPMTQFVFTVSSGFGHLTMLKSSGYKQRQKFTYIIGHKSDVAEFNQLLDSLVLQVMSSLKNWQKDNAEDRRWLTGNEREAENWEFVRGFGVRVGRRLAEERREAVSEASKGAELVLVSKKKRVNDWVGEQYPKLKTARGSSSSGSYAAHLAGQAAGAQANLGHKSVGGTKGELS